MLTRKVKRLAIALFGTAALSFSSCAAATQNQHAERVTEGDVDVIVMQDTGVGAEVVAASCTHPEEYIAFAADGHDSRQVISSGQRVELVQDFDRLEAARVRACQGDLERLVQDGQLEFFVRHGGTDAPPREHPTYRGVREDDDDPVLTLSTTWAHDVTNAGAPARAGLTGQGVRIGVLDTGVDPDVPEFADRIIGFHDFVFNRAGAYDDGDHGTFCISIINRVVPDAEYIVYKIHDGEGYNSITDVLEAFDQVIADRPDVLNNSWGLSEPRELEGMSWEDGNRVLAETIERVSRAGVLIETSAGNDSYYGTFTMSQLPEGSPHAISTGATTIRGEIANFSDLDAHIFAPGHLVFGTRSATRADFWSGTSFSGPFTVAAIVIIEQYGNQIGREFTRDEVVQILQESGRLESSTIIGPDGTAERYEFCALDYARLVDHLRRNYE